MTINYITALRTDPKFIELKGKSEKKRPKNGNKYSIESPIGTYYV